jgi:hypothetical protein
MVIVRLNHQVYSYYLRSIFLSTNLVSLTLLYIVQETRVLVGLQYRVLVGLHDSNVTRITWKES